MQFAGTQCRIFVIKFFRVAVIHCLANPANSYSRARVIKRRRFNDGDANEFAATTEIKPPHARYSLRDIDHHLRAGSSLMR
jgi:hypothetical protein